MRKVPFVIIGFVVCAIGNFAYAAVSVKKAAPVATTQTSSTASVSSLLPTAIGLISTVQQLTKSQKELTAECIPSSQEQTFVDNIIKEWAKTGAKTSEEALKAINKDVKCCDKNNAMAKDYATSVKNAAELEMPDIICYDCFNGAADSGTIWYGYPRVGITSYCPDGSGSCKDKKTVSNIYDVFNLVDFSKDDYTVQEASMASKLISKIENCSTAKLSARKRAMWGEFLINTIGTVGQPTSSATVMDTVSNMLNSGGALSGLGSLGSIATQLLDK
ncbi:MAG: hypothetical protein IJ560_04040 [Alphaproteobacteria bacterium]|nr:hypothetical protein [Alphaproteobacteria bacterium]